MACISTVSYDWSWTIQLWRMKNYPSPKKEKKKSNGFLHLIHIRHFFFNICSEYLCGHFIWQIFHWQIFWTIDADQSEEVLPIWWLSVPSTVHLWWTRCLFSFLLDCLEHTLCVFFLNTNAEKRITLFGQFIGLVEHSLSLDYLLSVYLHPLSVKPFITLTLLTKENKCVCDDDDDDDDLYNYYVIPVCLCVTVIHSPVSWGERIHRLHLCSGVAPCNKCPGYDIKPFEVAKWIDAAPNHEISLSWWKCPGGYQKPNTPVLQTMDSGTRSLTHPLSNDITQLPTLSKNHPGIVQITPSQPARLEEIHSLPEAITFMQWGRRRCRIITVIILPE